MNRLATCTALAFGLIVARATWTAGQAPSSPAPAPAASKVLATVNGEKVTVTDLSRDLAAGGAEAKAMDPARVLDRRINVVLVLQEAARMGLQDTLEVRDQMGIFERDTLRDGLFATRVASIKADPKAVDAVAREMSTEVSMRSAMFGADADAKRLAERATKGEDFDKVASELSAGGKGQVDPGEGWIRTSELRPEVNTVLGALKPGQVSPVYRIGEKFAVTRLVDRRTVKDQDVRAKAEAEVVKRRQVDVIAGLVNELKKKYATTDAKVLASADFDANSQKFDSFLKDKRPVVAIAGEPPITVADVADALRKRLFHGTEGATGKGKLNRRKADVLDDLVAKRVVMKEARRLGLDKKPEYVALRKQTESQLMFGAFVAKAIEPEIKVGDEEVRTYYQAHIKDYGTPDMMRFEGLAFDGRKAAEDALVKLRAGADLAWMRANAPGRADLSKFPDALVIPSAPVTTSSLPDDLKQAVAGARSGEFRLYVQPSGPAFVLLVKDAIVGKPQPIDDVSSGIRKKLAGEKRQKAFDEYAAKLRKASDVKVLVTTEELKRIAASVTQSGV